VTATTQEVCETNSEPHVIQSVDNVTKRHTSSCLPRKEHDDEHDDELAVHSEAEVPSTEERRRKILARKIPVPQQLRYLFLYSWAAFTTFILLPFIPAGFAMYYTRSNVVAVFCVNFVAIVPSASMLGMAVDQLSIRLGDKMGALLNMTFGWVLYLD
jgi:Ca2+:H+ antiporter